MKIQLWKGFHNSTLLPLMEKSLVQEDLLILCPPQLRNYDFLDYLPEGSITLTGNWNRDEKTLLEEKSRQRNFRNDFPQSPEFGIFSSGTLSLQPRLILFRREQVQASLAAILKLFDQVQFDKIFCYPQPFHIFGFALGYMQALLYERSFFALDGKYQQSFHKAWLEQVTEGTMTLGAPVHFRDLLAFSGNTQPNASATCIVGGAPVSRALWLDIKHKLNVLHPSVGYGATEACPGLGHLAPGHCPDLSGEIGSWLEGVHVAVEPGRGFYFSGSNQCLAIIDTNQNTSVLVFPKKIFIADEIETNAAGTLIYKGRSDWKLNRGAEKHSLEAIEHELEVRLSTKLVAVALPDPRLGEKLGIVLHDPFANADLRTQICSLVKKNFGWDLLESEVLALPALPLSLNGKIDRRECQSLLRNSAVKDFQLSGSN